MSIMYACVNVDAGAIHVSVKRWMRFVMVGVFMTIVGN